MTGLNNDNLARKKRIKRKRKTTLLRIGCWNVTSFNNKDQEILLEIKGHKLDICALSETKKKGKGNSKYGNYILIYSGKNKNERATSGVGLLLHESYENQISNIIYVNDRILQVTINLQKSRPTHIISIYAPDSSKTQADIDIFYQTLQTVLDGIPNHDEIIILGDFNARIGDELIPGIKNRFNAETINESGEKMIQLCILNELRINNTFYPHKPQHKYTFENTRGHKSTIDYIITNKNIHPTRIQDTRSLTSANAGTNHQLVMAKMRTTIQPIKEVSKLNIESLSDESTNCLYQQRLREKIAANNIQETDDIETAWTKLRTNILQAAEEARGRRTIKKGGRINTKS
ncbi:craniofacial development protein 2-like [Diorhabda sublineata]|uniref:craniofacial development protein 2-like n=1 Tax=Diorhabda sublineata TaxID=1163346 RepID=UPI0024E11776|nr:craniofacial development protein 2-like [Diorhabda sublineata]